VECPQYSIRLEALGYATATVELSYNVLVKLNDLRISRSSTCNTKEGAGMDAVPVRRTGAYRENKELE